VKLSNNQTLLGSKKLIFLLKCPTIKVLEGNRETIVLSFIEEFHKYKFIVNKTYYLYSISSDGLVIDEDRISFKLNSLEYTEVAKLFKYLHLPSVIEEYIKQASGHIFLGVSEH
jgi:hypothetical protein